jgi:hypothetical protein
MGSECGGGGGNPKSEKDRTWLITLDGGKGSIRLDIGDGGKLDGGLGGSP